MSYIRTAIVLSFMLVGCGDGQTTWQVELNGEEVQSGTVTIGDAGEKEESKSWLNQAKDKVKGLVSSGPSEEELAEAEAKRITDEEIRKADEEQAQAKFAEKAAENHREWQKKLDQLAENKTAANNLLDELIVALDDRAVQGEGFVHCVGVLGNDPWDVAFRVTYQQINFTEYLTVCSAGPDLVFDTPDDLCRDISAMNYPGFSHRTCNGFAVVVFLMALMFSAMCLWRYFW